MSQVYQFGGYTVRQATADDRELLAVWIDGDRDHLEKGVTPDFFIDEEPGVGCYLLSDEHGPLWFFRTSNVVRVDTQFGRSESAEDRERNRTALVDWSNWLAVVCALKNTSELLFETVNPPLARLAIHAMGCERRPDTLVRSLEPERSVAEMSYSQEVA